MLHDGYLYQTLPTIEEFKLEVKKARELYGMRSSHAHEALARSYGFNTWIGMRTAILKGQSNG